MLDTSYSNFFTSGYYIFANGILVIALAVVMHGFDTGLANRFKLKWLATGVLATGASRVLFSFSLLQHSQTLLVLEGVFALLCIHFYAEYLRLSCCRNKPVDPLLLHLPIFLLLLYGFWFSGMEREMRALSLLAVGLLVCYTGLKNTNQLPAEVKKHIQGCFVLAAIGFTMQIGMRFRLQLDWNTLEPIAGAVVSQWQFLLPTALVIAIITLTMLARHSREKLHWHSLRGDLGLYSHLIFLLVIVLILFAGAIAGRHLERQRKFQNEVALTQALERLAELVNQRITMAANYSAAIAAAPILSQYLDNPDQSNQQLINRYFEVIARKNPDGMCFLVGSSGRILVSTNQSDSIIGLDVSFRDYFKQAMAGQSSDLIDYGKATGELGFYSINPVFRFNDGKALGALTVKRNLTDLESLLKLYHPAMIVDDNDYVFMASDKKMEHRRLVLGSQTINGTKTPADSDSKYHAAPLIVQQMYMAAQLNKDGWKVVMLSAGSNGNTNIIWLMITLSLVSLTVILVLNSAVINIRSREDYEIAQERFKTVFYHAPESIIIISADSLKILEANHSMIRQFGLTENIVGASYFSLLPPQRNITNVWHDRKEKLFKHQRLFVKSNGEAFSAEVTGAPITFNHQRALILLLHDITSQKQIELELRQAKTAAENANKLKTRFFANASHEIRTPMTAIIGLTEMALTMCQSPEQQKLLNLTRSSGKSLLELVNDILDLSKIESGKLNIKPGAFNLHQLLKELQQLFEFEAAHRPVKIEFVLNPDLPQNIVSDAVRLRQILINLLNNALKFTSRGEIKLLARVITDQAKDKIEIKVCDTGCGISQDQQAHLFEPFTYSDQYTRHESKGAGLGLAICKQITDLLDGSLFVEKTSSTGTIFTLVIPFERVEKGPEQPETQVIQQRLSCAGRALHFLVADDNEINLFLAGSIIEKHGGSHEFARNGREALEKLLTSTYDLALIDIQMPELDGLTVIKRLRQGDKKLASIPIIAVSAFISDQEKQEAVQAGADSYLVKPYFPNDLLSAIEQLLKTDKAGNLAPEIGNEKSPPATPATGIESIVLKQIDAGELEIRILKKPENILKISDIFARRSVELMAELAECEESRDCSRLREVVHSIKGLVGMLGAQKSFQLALELENLCKAGQLESALVQLPTLKEHITEIAQDLKILQQQVGKKTV